MRAALLSVWSCSMVQHMDQPDNTDFPGQPHLPGRRGETITVATEPVEPMEGEPQADPVHEIGSTEPVDEIERPAMREKQTDAWHRELSGGRVEVMCRTPGFRIRVSAPEAQAWEAVELFEKWTGLAVQSERRPRKRVSPPPGQLNMTELTDEPADS